MNKFKFSNYKLPHMGPITFKKVVEEKLPEFDRTPKRLDVKKAVELKQTVSSSGGKEKDKDAFSVQADLTDSGQPWSTFTADEIKALEGSGVRPRTQMYRGQVVPPNENIAWQTPKQAAETEKLENTQSLDYPEWESKISENEKKRLAELKANTLSSRGRDYKAEMDYYNSLKSKYNN